MDEDLVSSSDGERSVGEPDRIGDEVGSETGRRWKELGSVDRSLSKSNARRWKDEDSRFDLDLQD